MKVFVICKKVDGFDNDIYVYTDKFFLNTGDVLTETRKKMLQNYKEYLINIQEEIEERIEALNNDSYITGANVNINLSMTSEIKNNFDECRYGDFFIQEVEVI